MAWRDTLQEKIEWLNSVDDIFLDEVEKVQQDILSRVLRVLQRLAQKEGKLIEDQVNDNLIARLRRSILRSIRHSAFVPLVQEFLLNLDVSEEFNKRIYEEMLKVDWSVELSPYKKLFAEEITDALTSRSALVQRFVNPIRRMIIGAIDANMDASQARELLENLIVGDEERTGIFRRYTGQVARDAISQYDGKLNDLTRDAYRLNAFEYIGITVEDSREFCLHLRAAPGPPDSFEGISISANIFEDLAIAEGRYLVKDIPEILERGGDWKGKNPLVTPETFAQYRGGYNCLDSVIYMRSNTQ